MEKRFDDNIFKKIFRMFHSMKFGIVLLIVIGVLSIIGTIIPQNRSDVFYMENYHGFFL
jgi:cytochrome c biogenesis protein